MVTVFDSVFNDTDAFNISTSSISEKSMVSKPNYVASYPPVANATAASIDLNVKPVVITTTNAPTVNDTVDEIKINSANTSIADVTVASELEPPTSTTNSKTDLLADPPVAATEFAETDSNVTEFAESSPITAIEPVSVAETLSTLDSLSISASPIKGTITNFIVKSHYFRKYKEKDRKISRREENYGQKNKNL